MRSDIIQARELAKLETARNDIIQARELTKLETAVAEMRIEVAQLKKRIEELESTRAVLQRYGSIYYIDSRGNSGLIE